MSVPKHSSHLAYGPVGQSKFQEKYFANTLKLWSWNFIDGVLEDDIQCLGGSKMYCFYLAINFSEVLECCLESTLASKSKTLKALKILDKSTEDYYLGMQ